MLAHSSAIFAHTFDLTRRFEGSFVCCRGGQPPSFPESLASIFNVSSITLEKATQHYRWHVFLIVDRTPIRLWIIFKPHSYLEHAYIDVQEEPSLA